MTEDRGAEWSRLMVVIGEVDVGCARAGDDLLPAVTDVVSFLKLFAPVSLGVHVGLERGMNEAISDPGQIDHVLPNLVLDAVSRMTGDRTLCIRAENTVLSTAAQDDPDARQGPCVRLSVSDTGQGIDGDTLRLALRSFFTTQRRGAGYRVGLAAARRIIRDHKGSIVVESVPRRRTTVSILLPIPVAGRMPGQRGTRQSQPERGATLTVEPRALPRKEADDPK